MKRGGTEWEFIGVQFFGKSTPTGDRKTACEPVALLFQDEMFEWNACTESVLRVSSIRPMPFGIILDLSIMAKKGKSLVYLFQLMLGKV